MNGNLQRSGRFFALTTILLAALLTASLCLRIHAAPPVSQTETKEVVTFLGSLGLPSLRDLQAVEVWTGGWSQGSDGTRVERSMTIPAFLVHDEGDKFRVLTLWLQSLTFLKVSELKNPHRVRYEARSVDWLLNIYFEQLGQMGGSIDGPLPSDLLQTALLYKYAMESGMSEWSAKAEARMREAFGNRPGNSGNDNLQTSVRSDAAHYLLQLRLALFGVPNLSWLDIQSELKAYLAIFHEGIDHDHAKLLADGVASYLKEETNEPLLSNEEVQKLPKERQAVELVRRLRLQGMPQTKDGDNVVGELLKLGHVAVPALLAAADDRRPTRQVSFLGWKAWDHEGRLQSVGDQAVSLLMQVSGKLFENRGQSGVFVSPSDGSSKLKIEIESWWSEYQRKGERQFLIDTVSAGGPDICNQARMLMAKYPDDAGDAITAGFAKLKSPTDRHNLIWGLDRLKNAKIIALLRRELTGGQSLECRAGAAYSLRKLGESDTSAAMLKEWQNLLGQRHGDGTGSVIRHLASSQEIPTVRELIKTMPERPVWARVAIIEGLAEAYDKATWNDNKPSSADWKIAVEDVLASSLSDDEEQVGLSGVGYHDPSVGDQAAWRLSQVLPKEYEFDIGAGFAAREKARNEMLQHWHLKRGKSWNAAVPPEQLPDSQRNRVVAIRFADSNLQGTAIEHAILALKGKDVNADEIVSVLCAFGEKMPPGVNGLSLRFVRTTEPLGVHATVWSRLGKHPEKWQDFSWHGGIDLNQKAVTQATSGSRMHQNIGKPDEWKAFRDNVTEVLKAPSTSEIVIRVGVKASNDE